ncbi:RNA polymerase II subunit A C-terminal domain phosphatase isoform X2 [Heterodontus francisci]|uniref:RNA polymerase II subunit A C-terminal domain phosphatase isoform X2 n=1 Tax=Heterodontus francisci TaxID=7792 RepID=UPI00355C4458
MAALAEAREPDRDQDREPDGLAAGAAIGSGTAAAAPAVLEVAAPGSRPLRLLEWSVRVGWPVQIGTVLAHCLPVEQESGAERERPRPQEKRVKSDRAGVVKELCWQPGQVVPSGSVLVRLEGCSHPIVMKGLCAACGQDLTQLQKKNGKQMMPVSTATVSMVHSVPELMVSSEQAEQLGREDQQWLHKNRKLVLMVDLDQTLIHTTEQLCQKMSNKGIFHFQLGRGEPMLHTRLRPHCKEFLEKIAKLYELHVFTFGSRLYAHTIAGFLDPEKKLFSHRILSRDECIDPYSKTGNLRNLFPCGDSMVCIIDDREDVWKFAPNLIAVKKYTYFQGTGDINAPPGSRDAQAKKRVNHSSKPTEGLEQPESTPTDAASTSNRCSEESEAKEQSNGLGECPKKQNGTEKVRQAQACKHLHVVNPDWLWSSLERWEKVDEKLFPLKEDYVKTQRTNSPASFPELQAGFQTPLFHPTPIHPKAQPGPEVRIYDPNTGKLIRKDSQGNRQSVCIQPPAPPVTLPVHGEQSSFRVVQPHQHQILDDDELPNSSQSEEKPGPSRAGARKRQPSMSETMPLYTLCKEDLESMDKEVDDILGEDSDNESESEKEEKMEEQHEQPQEETQQQDQQTMQSGVTEKLKPEIETRPKSSSSEGSLTGRVPRGHKRKLEDDGAGSDSSKLSSNEDDSSSEADEMAAALEAELNDFI